MHSRARAPRAPAPRSGHLPTCQTPQAVARSPVWAVAPSGCELLQIEGPRPLEAFARCGGVGREGVRTVTATALGGAGAGMEVVPEQRRARVDVVDGVGVHDCDLRGKRQAVLVPLEAAAEPPALELMVLQRTVDDQARVGREG